jgi:hypothetical protein
MCFTGRNSHLGCKVQFVTKTQRANLLRVHLRYDEWGNTQATSTLPGTISGACLLLSVGTRLAEHHPTPLAVCLYSRFD